MNRYHLIGILMMAGALLGCGGGGSKGGGNGDGSPSQTGKGSAVMPIDWPLRDRAIPYTSNSIDVTLIQNGKTVVHKIFNRPAGVAPHSDALFEGLPEGNLRADIRAFPEPGAVGTPQASGSTAFHVSGTTPVSFPVTLRSTIASLSIVAPEAPSLGTSVTFSLSAKDSSGKTVLLRYGGYQETINWTSSVPEVASILGAGASASVRALTPGNSTITASFSADDEATQLTAQKTISVVTASGTVVIR